MIRFRLDNLILDELPLGWDDLTTNVTVDRSLLFARLVNIDTRLTWYRDGYDYLLQQYRQVNGCTQVQVVIEEDPQAVGAWEVIYRGIIKLAAVKWNYEPDSADTPIEDDSWYSFLTNNKAIEVNVTLPQTKNGITTLLIQPKTVQGFDPASGIYDNVARTMYTVHDVLEWIVRYLSDEEVGFRSDVLSTGEFRNMLLQTGYRLRTQLEDKLPLTLTLEDALKECSKHFALGCQLQFTGARPILRVEPIDYFYQRRTELQLDHVQPVEVTTDVARLYATVTTGGEQTQEQGNNLSFPEQTRWYGFAKEQYYLLGQCNLNANLDLVRGWVTSSNVWQELVVNNVDTWDEDVFLLSTYDPNLLGTRNATQTNWLAANTPPFYYNEALTNEQVVTRWLGGIPNTLAAELGALVPGRFRASSNVPTAWLFRNQVNTGNVTWTPVNFQDETTPPNFDTGGVYDPGLARWYAPSAGLYELNAEVLVQHYLDAGLNGPYSGSVQTYYTVRYLRYNAANTLQATYISDPWLIDWDQYHDPGAPACTWTADVNLTKTLNWTRSIPCDAGDYVVVQLAQSTSAATCSAPQFWTVFFRIAVGSYFQCQRTTELGDFTEYVNPDAARNVLLRFDAPLGRDQLRGLLANLSGAVVVNTNGRTFKGWVERLKFDAGTNLASFTLLTSKNLLP